MTDYTEVRIKHNSVKDKIEYEKKLAEALKREGYKNRVEYFKECIRNLSK